MFFSTSQKGILQYSTKYSNLKKKLNQQVYLMERVHFISDLTEDRQVKNTLEFSSGCCQKKDRSARCRFARVLSNPFILIEATSTTFGFFRIGWHFRYYHISKSISKSQKRKRNDTYVCSTMYIHILNFFFPIVWKCH